MSSFKIFLDISTVRCMITNHLKSVTLDHFIAENATAHKVNSYYTLAISYCTFCVGKHTILGPGGYFVKTQTEGLRVLMAAVSTYS